MRGKATITRPDLLGSIMEVGLTTEDKLTSHNILQGLQVTLRLKNHPKWPKRKLNTHFFDLGPQSHPQQALHAVGTLQPQSQACIHALQPISPVRSMRSQDLSLDSKLASRPLPITSCNFLESLMAWQE